MQEMVCYIGPYNHYNNFYTDKEPVWLVDIDIDPRAQQMAKMDVSDIEILKNLFDGIIY
jgi:hypothetical protein